MRTGPQLHKIQVYFLYQHLNPHLVLVESTSLLEPRMPLYSSAYTNGTTIRNAKLRSSSSGTRRSSPIPSMISKRTSCELLISASQMTQSGSPATMNPIQLRCSNTGRMRVWRIKQSSGSLLPGYRVIPFPLLRCRLENA